MPQAPKPQLQSKQMLGRVMEEGWAYVSLTSKAARRESGDLKEEGTDWRKSKREPSRVLTESQTLIWVALHKQTPTLRFTLMVGVQV